MNTTDLLTIAEVAQKMRLSTKQITRLADAGQFPEGLRIGPKSRRWTAAAIDGYIQQLTEDQQPKNKK